MTRTCHDNGLDGILQISILWANVFALSGLLLLGLAFVGGDAFFDVFLSASTLFAAVALLMGFVCIVTFVARWMKNRQRFQPMRLLGLAIAFVACYLQFWLGWLGYGFGEQPVLSDLCFSAAHLSVILLVVTLVLPLLRLVARFMAAPKN